VEPVAGHSTLSRFVRSERGFTLIELLVVVVLIGITSAMFAVTFGTVVNRSSAVSDQSILQTEVRASLNSAVEDIRSATLGDSTFPITAPYTNSSITFYSPDRLSPDKMRKIRYFLQGSNCSVSECSLMRQITYSTNSMPICSPTCAWTWPGTDPAAQVVVKSIRAPVVAPQAGAPQSGWEAGQIFKYCAQNPLDLRPLEESTYPDPITWTCTSPGTVSNIKTIVIRAAISATPISTKYNYGAVATLRWNAS
jgi:prepilin-type N-terminal cleavage/methylation domain-containing protein